MDDTGLPDPEPAAAEGLQAVADRLGVALEVVEAVASALDTQPLLETWDPPSAPAVDPLASPPALPGPALSERYEVLELLGEGGMGSVHRVYDRQLERTVALKVLHPSMGARPANAARFLEEAQVSAQLQHPAIVPVHDYGQMPDGRAYITMKEVRGQTLAQAIGHLHAGREEWTLRRMLEVFLRAVEGVAYAHDRGVVHRDLKPENIMLGDHGEVSILDWGLARVGIGLSWGPGVDPVVSNRTERTRVGAVAGSPAYMAPEQARGQTFKVTARTDVYALGGVLYEILTGKHPLYGMTAQEIMARLRADVRIPPPRGGRFDIPPELEQLVARSTTPDPAGRPADAQAFGAALRDWLDGARRRERALALVAQADQAGVRAQELSAGATTLQAQAAAQLAETPPWSLDAARTRAWQVEDDARERRIQAEEAQDERSRLLSAALTQDPGCVEAHAGLAADYRALHAEAEARGDAREARRWERQVRNHDRGEHAAWLEGTGALSLVTDPPAQAMLYRYVERGRRLVEEPVGSLGTTPLIRHVLPRGSYLVVLQAPGCQDLRYPVRIGRQEHWDGVAPRAGDPAVVRLPRLGELDPDDVCVSAGWFWSGGHVEGIEHPLPRRRLWADGFVIRRHPVTCAEYVAFLDDLVDQGREAEALRWAPREVGGGEAILLGRTPAGHFQLVPDSQGDEWPPSMPVIMVDPDCARAYAAWWSERTGERWMLPPELLWQKACRGVDGRLYPWGSHYDPVWCCGRDGRQGSPRPGPVDEFPGDVSPYGVRGLAGNVLEWSHDAYPQGGPVHDQRVQVGPFEAASRRVLLGGAWTHGGAVARADFRLSQRATFRSGTVGLRLLRNFL